MTTNERPQNFIDIKADEMMARVEDYYERGWRFVNICGSTVEAGVELIYSFSDGLPFDNLRFVVANGEEVPSVSALYPNAFFFENETFDLFGVRFSGVSIDFNGKFYKVSVPTPMNPQSVIARAAAKADGSGDGGGAGAGSGGSPAKAAKTKPVKSAKKGKSDQQAKIGDDKHE